MDFLSKDSYWLKPRPPASFPALSSDCRADVAVVGAGITGLSVALHLKQAGQRVVVLEAGRVGAGTTGGTSGHLDVAPDQGFAKLVSACGEQAAREITAARFEAIDQIERWSAALSADCDFRRVPARAYTERPDRIDHLQAEYEAALGLGVGAAIQRDAGLPFPTARAMEISNQGRFHAIRYLAGLARAVHGGDAAIYENTFAQTPEDGTPCVIRANGHEVTARDVVLATHSAFLGISLFDVRQAAYQSYVIALRVNEDVPDALYWDDEQPYRYLRRASSHDPRLLIVGGADHKTGQGRPEESVQQLEAFAVQRFPGALVEQRWSAELFEPSDGLPLIGRVPAASHLFIATGFSGTGLTYGTAAARIIADLILDRPSSTAGLFSPLRFKPLTAAKQFISENLNVAKHFVADRFSAEQVSSLDEIRPGQGALVNLNGKSYAVYRDENNQLHQLSPVCTHAGCYVQWNPVENTWDCPCHGGRYAPTGERIYGPPAAALRQA